MEKEKCYHMTSHLKEIIQDGKLDITSTISYSVVNSGIIINANCIIANTMSGYTAKKISNFRPNCLILGLSPNKNTLKSLTLNYGIIPILVKKYNETDEIVSECINKYKEIMNYNIGDTIIITGGFNIQNKEQTTNFLKIIPSTLSSHEYHFSNRYN